MFPVDLLVPKSKFNGGSSWTQELQMPLDEWKARKAAACVNCTDQFLSSNYSTVANLLNIHSNSVRQCTPITNRQPEAPQINVYGYPADLPYAWAFPNPLVQLSTPTMAPTTAAILFRLSCDFDKDHFAPVYSFMMNLTQLQSLDNSSKGDW